MRYHNKRKYLQFDTLRRQLQEVVNQRNQKESALKIICNKYRMLPQKLGKQKDNNKILTETYKHFKERKTIVHNNYKNKMKLFIHKQIGIQI